MKHGYDTEKGYYYRESGPRYYPSPDTEYKQFVERERRDGRTAACLALVVGVITLTVVWLLTHASK